MEAIEIFEYIFGFSNSIIGLMIVFYVAKGFGEYKKNNDLKLIKLVKGTMLAVFFLSLYSFSHFFREIFSLKNMFGPIVEIPEYIFILVVYLVLIWQLIVFDMPD